MIQTKDIIKRIKRIKFLLLLFSKYKLENAIDALKKIPNKEKTKKLLRYLKFSPQIK